MAYRGHQKAIASFFAACGLGGASYGTHRYIKKSAADAGSVAVDLLNATTPTVGPLALPTVAPLGYTTVTSSHTYTTYIDPKETEALIEVNSPPSVPPNTAFRKQGLGSQLSYSSILLGLSSLFDPAFQILGGFRSLILLGFVLLVGSALAYWKEEVVYFSKGLIENFPTQNPSKTRSDREDGENSLPKGDPKSAQSLLADIHQVVDPESKLPLSKTLELVELLAMSRKPWDRQLRETRPQTNLDVSNQDDGSEEASNRERTSDRAENEIARLNNQIMVEKLDYRHKKDHYKAIAHHVVSSRNTKKATIGAPEDSLQKRLRGIMDENDDRLSFLQIETERLTEKLAEEQKRHAQNKEELANFRQDANKKDLEIETVFSIVHANEAAQLLRFQKRDDAIQERELKLREQLEKAQKDKSTEVAALQNKIRFLTREIAKIEKERNVAMADLERHAQVYNHSIERATQGKDQNISKAKAEVEAFNATTLAWQQKEDHMYKIVREQERQIQEQQSKYSSLLASVAPASHDKPEKGKVAATSSNVRTRKKSPAAEPPSRLPTSQEGKVNLGTQPSQRMVAGSKPSQTTSPQTNPTTFPPKNANMAADALESTDDEHVSAHTEKLKEGDTHRGSAHSSSSTTQPPPQIPRVSDDKHAGLPRPDVTEHDESLDVTAKPVAEKGDSEEEKSKPILPSTQKSPEPASKPAQSQRTSSKPPFSLPGLHSTISHQESKQKTPTPPSSDSSKPKPILFKFTPVNFTASGASTAHPPTAPEQSPLTTTNGPTPESALMKGYKALHEGRRSNEAEINSRHKMQPRRRNQADSVLAQPPRSQSTSAAWKLDKIALTGALAPPQPTVPEHTDALALYDKANALGKVS